jgi:predicted ATPase
MLTDGGIVKVMDFGLARSEGRTRLTQAGMLVGTVAYMAPEQVLGGEVDHRSDLYSLGCVMYELVASRPPFTGDDPITIISHHLQVPPVAPHWYNPKISPELEGIILKLMAKDPAERYTSAGDALAALEQLTTAMPFVPAEATPSTPAFLLGTVLRTRFVGRDAELRELRSTLELAASGHGQVVLVEGEPGIGKTRLLQEAQVYARLRGFTVMLGRCYEQETGVPYLPWIELLQGRFKGIERAELLDDLGEVGSEFVKLIPEVRRALPEVQPSPPLEPVQERLRLFASVAEYMAKLSRRTPLVLVLEDLHWADAASLNLLQHLARVLHGERVVILGSYRDVEVDRKHPLSNTLREMNRDRLFTDISLRRLQRDAVGSMVRAVFEMAQVSDEFLDPLYWETEGNPFFVEEVLKSLVEEGAIYREDGQWRWKEISEISVPKSVKEVIGRRLEHVSESCQRVLSMAAIIGRRFRFEVLQAIGELPEEALLDALEEAMRTQLVREESAAGEVEYDFAHALLREVLYERLSLRRRMTLHQKVGETFERLYAGRLDSVVEELAHHFTRAPHGVGLQKAVQYSLDAGRKAMSLFAHEEAVRYYQNALELLGEIGDERRIAETDLALAEALQYLGDTAGLTRAYESAIKYYRQRGSSAQVAQVEALMGRALGRHREFAEAIPYLQHALEHLSVNEYPEELIRIHLDLGRALLFLGQHKEATDHLQQGLDLAVEHRAALMQADGHVSLGLIAQRNVDFDRAMAQYTQALAILRESVDPQAHYIRSRALTNMAAVHVERGQWDDVIAVLRQSVDEARRSRNFGLLVVALWRLAAQYFFEGQWKMARELAEENLQLPLSSPWIEDSRTMLRRMDGDLQGAIASLSKSAKEAKRTGDQQMTFVRYADLTWAYLELGLWEKAREAADEGAIAIEGDESFLMGFRSAFVAEALVRTGEHERCRVLCERGEAVNRKAGSSRGFSGVRVGRAMLDLDQGDLEGAVRRLEEALSVIHYPLWRVHAMQRLAWAFQRRGREGDKGRAVATLRQTLALLDQMGDKRKAEQVRAEITALTA